MAVSAGRRYGLVWFRTVLGLGELTKASRSESEEEKERKRNRERKKEKEGGEGADEATVTASG